MKFFSKIVLGIFALSALVYAQPFEQKSSKSGYEIMVTSDKSLVVGSNDIYVALSKDGKAVTNVKVKIKFFMPEMPGMPYMEQEDKAKIVDGKYKTNINFSMSGTWQYNLKFKTNDGEVVKVRGSVNL